MKMLIRITALAALLLVGGSALVGGPAFGAQISLGIRIGPPPRARVVRVPARPGPDYVWVDGYYYPVRGRYAWHAGYWTRPPYAAAHWVGPRYEGGQFFNGYWDGDRGRVEHDHAWDRDKDRDRDRFHDDHH